MIRWEDDTDIENKPQIYNEDIICDWCEKWAIIMVHDENNDVYCGNCIQEIAEYIRVLNKGRLIAGEEIIFDLEKKIDKCSDMYLEWKELESERQEYKRSNYGKKWKI